MKFKDVINTIKPNEVYKTTNEDFNLKSIASDENGIIVLDFSNENTFLAISDKQEFEFGGMLYE